ncbi:MAG: glycosyltransferase [Candidatus Bathyarchaeia archaeon]
MVILLRVGIFIPTLNVCGGAEYVAIAMANALARQSYEVVLFTNEPVNHYQIRNFLGVSLNPSIKCIVFPSLARPYYLLDFYQTIFRSYIFRLKCDLWIDVYSRRIFPWTNITYIHFPFSRSQWYRPKFPYLRRPRFMQAAILPYVIFEKKLVRDDGKLILANSQYTAEEIRTFLGKKAEVLYPPVQSTCFESKTEKLVKKPRKDLVVTVSRYSLPKQLEMIPYIASFTRSSVEFALIGRVYDNDTLRTLISLQRLTKKLGLTDRIKFFTNISRGNLKEILKSAKVYLHTMVGEHFGISIVEAMAMGCISIVHDSGGPREFVPDNLRYKTVKEAAEKIEKEICGWTPQKANEMIEIAQRFKEENFSKKFIDFFNQYKTTFENNLKYKI